jgi:hypothetical protein
MMRNLNDPVPEGWALMAQAAVTAELTAWAISLLHDMALSMGDMVMRGGTLARIEWHPPDGNNSGTHRGVTLYTWVGP